MVGKVNMGVLHPKDTARCLCQCTAGCHIPRPRDRHTRAHLPGCVSIILQKHKCVGKVLIISYKFPLVTHEAAQGSTGCYTHVEELLLSICLVSPQLELFGITLLSQGPITWLHQIETFVCRGNFF